MAEDEIDTVVALHKKFNGHATQVANAMGRSIGTITRCWREKGLKVHPKGGKKR